MSIPDYFFNSFDFNIGKYSINVPYIQAIAIVFLLFLLVITLAQVRHHYLDWSFKGATFGIFFGFVLALILEGFLLVYGKTALTGVLGWKDAPKPLSIVLDAGRAKLSNVLGESTQSTEVSTTDILKSIQSLNPADSKKIKSIICSQ